ENARAFERSIERINAQQEAILQTLSSAQSALARMHLAREADSAATEEIAGVVARMNAQTTAVEQAVQEVMSLRSS
ncbi:MAG TPA: hypothetical protein VGS41_08520, partial [Chthonomonadales bacterium]|nr:hypothetical protein [Chthonomonadales bacterium]